MNDIFVIKFWRYSNVQNNVVLIKHYHFFFLCIYLVFIVSSQYRNFMAVSFLFLDTTYKDIDKKFSLRIALFIFYYMYLRNIIGSVRMCDVSFYSWLQEIFETLCHHARLWTIFFYTCIVKRIFKQYFPQKNSFYLFISHNKISMF